MSQLRIAFEAYLQNRDDRALATAIELHGGVSPSAELDVPIAHRICDLNLQGLFFRVARIYDVTTRDWQLLIYPTDKAYPSDKASDQEGVPYELQGQGLHQWVIDELENPSNKIPDWEDYLKLMPHRGTT